MSKPGTHMQLKFFLLAVGVLTCSLQSWTAEGASTVQPSRWRSYDLIVDLHNLPHRYSCDDLWYRFRDVLLAIGARPDIKILAYRCEHGLGDANARSPRVHLQFFMPELLAAGQEKWADLDATPTTVRLAPGHPASLLNTDCELLRQMKDGLLASVSQRLISFNLACAAPPQSSHAPFSVTVQTLTPSGTSSRVVARTG
jgi:hypothetical protein